MEKYQKIRLVGRGAHGAVYLCTKNPGNKLVILKEIPVDQMSKDERQASMNEAKVLSMLDHPNVIAYYENFLEDKTIIIAMEYAQGGTLYDFLLHQNGQLLEEEVILRYFGQMVYALQHVHAKLILHRDLKSQNILLNEDRTIVKIGDFGISKILSSKSKAFTVVGTPCYISPELCEGKPYNQKSDIWALGCILYELMTLKRPFDANTLPALVMKIMKGNFDPVPDMYSQNLRRLLLRMLHLDPNRRPTAAEIMCQPFMIGVVFGLYVDVGSLPCIKRSHGNSSSLLQSSIGSGKSNLSEFGNNSEILFANESNPTKIETSIKLNFIKYKSKDITSLPTMSCSSLKSVALRQNNIMGITDKGLLITWNENSSGGCGIENSYSVNIIDEKYAVNIVSVAVGNGFVICLSSSGVVFTLGKASSGCLAQVTEKDVQQPKIVGALFGHNIVSVACGPRHVLAVSEENNVFAWGNGEHGCLGLGNRRFYGLPQVVHIAGEYKPVKAFCGTDSSFIITDEWGVLACGSNRHNKLALDTADGHQVDEATVFIPVHTKSLNESKIVSLATGKSHTLFLTNEGVVYTVGSNRFQQLGWGKQGVDYSMPGKVEKLTNENITNIACSDFYSLAINNRNALFAWGKCPRSFTESDDVFFDVDAPKIFEGKNVACASCGSEDCLILFK